MRDSFIFYGSFYEAIADLPDEERLKCYDIICEYALNNKIPEATGIAKSIFTLVKPNIDASIKRRKNGAKGGKGNKKDKYTSIEIGSTLPKYFQNTSDNFGSDKEREREVDVEREVEKEVDADREEEREKDKRTSHRETQDQMLTRLIEDKNIGTAMEDKIREWLAYKAERRESYKEQGLKTLLSKIMKSVHDHGEMATMDAIDTSMASGWKGLFFDKIRGKPQSVDDMFADWKSKSEEYERRMNDTG